MSSAAAFATSPSPVTAWVRAARLRTLPAAATPVAVGTAIAWASGGVRVDAAIAALLGALALQIGANFANDVFDFEKGADTEARVGPARAVASGWITPRAMRMGMAIVFALAMACGVVLTAIAGWPVVAIGLVSIAAAIAYTGGPFPLGWNGLGDVTVFAFFGPVAVAGTVLVELGRVVPVAWIASVPLGALAAAILVINNLRDEATDRVAGKKTLAVRFGRRAGFAEYVALLAVSQIGAGAVAYALRSFWPLLACATLPLLTRLAFRVSRGRGAEMNAHLAAQAMSLALFGVLLAFGIAFAGG